MSIISSQLLFSFLLRGLLLMQSFPQAGIY